MKPDFHDILLEDYEISAADAEYDRELDTESMATHAIPVQSPRDWPQPTQE